jgi:hypothetical protein
MVEVGSGVVGVLGVVVSPEAQPVIRTRRKIWIYCLSLNISVPPDSGHIHLTKQLASSVHMFV